MSAGSDNARWFLPSGSAADGGWSLVIDERTEGWEHTGLRTATLAAGESLELALGAREAVVVPLGGDVVVAVVDGEGGRHEAALAGRESVFAGPADVALAGRGSRLIVTGSGSGSRVAVCLAADPGDLPPAPFRHLPAAQIPVELRGAGIASRQVRNFGIPGVLEANRMIACEVITPAGNWSSWPPHKHDVERDGLETELEEIYYFETRSTDERGTDPVGYQRVYGTDERPIDVLAEVRSGDVVLVPHGWHGPAVAAPNADLYYLNVMAGPGPERAWLICDDPVHGWVRETWSDQEIDPRLR